jgi:uncharacterized protein YggE
MKRITFLILLLSTPLLGDVTSTRNIAVNATGYVYAEPDRMSWSIHVVTEGADLQELKKLNDESSEQVYQALSKYEIPTEKIRSSGITFRAGYKKNDPPYETKNVINFNTEKLGIYPELMDQLIGIKFVIVKDTDLYASNRSELEKEAAKLALLDAKNKAASMLAVYDESLGEVLKITEGYIFNHDAAVDYFAAPARSNNSSTSRINTGKIEIKKEIGVIFKIEDN